jgi:hypothetical protein
VSDTNTLPSYSQGYVVVSPTLPVDDGPRCFGINAFCAIEAFVGVLFVGFSSAIIFGKVSRMQSFATVVRHYCILWMHQ